LTIKTFDLAREDVEAARAWLDKRALDIDGDLRLVGWKDHLVASVVSHAEPEKKPKRGRRGTDGQGESGHGMSRQGVACRGKAGKAIDPA
jgi:hypothetical protein